MEIKFAPLHLRIRDANAVKRKKLLRALILVSKKINEG